ncbi:MAG TPA: IS256 family transposase [Acetivibrio saccincola]|nr:IS256 family transposase [Acetivibrio saccincola]
MGNIINYEEEIKKCKTQDDLFGENGLLKKLIKDAIEKMMEAEIEEYMGRKKYERTDTDEPEYRNGYRKKTVKSSVGEFDVNIPRDRQSGFKPIIIENYQSTCGEFDKKIIGMYAKGMTVRDIQAQIREVYGVEVSPDFISMVTDKVMTNVADWQNRLLDKVYPIVYMDAMHFKVRDDGRVVNRAAYICLGINKEGMKDILGIWIGESEGAKFWLGVCNELKVRGVQDILLACVDGLKGFPEAIKSVFPDAEIQTCIIRQIRNSIKYVASKDKKEFMKDLKPVYKAASEEIGFQNLELLESKWGKKYSIIIKSWYDNWENLSTFFKYPPEIRKIIYTTNTLEGFNRQLRKVTKTKSVFPNDEALKKSLYLGTMDILKKWTMPVANWGQVVAQFAILFEGRLELGL